MGYKSSSTRRTSAASAVSSQSVVINTATGFAAVGATIKSNTAISLGVTTVGQTSAASKTTVSAGPVIGNVQYLDANNAVLSDDIAVSTAGGNVLINGSGFAANSNIYVNNTLVSNTFISSTQIRAELPAASVGNVALMIFTPTNVGTISVNAIRYSGFPSWTTAAVSLQNNIAANVALVASGDSTLTYALQDGSSLPTGISLNSAGYLTGTASGYSSGASTSAVIIVTDAEGQAAQQTINFTITAGDDRFTYTTLLLNGETSSTPFHSDASANGFGLTLAGDVRADQFSPYYGNGYYSTLFSATPDYFTLPVSANLAFAGDYTIECWVYLNSVTGTQGVYSSIDNSADAWQGPYIGFSGTSFLATSYISGPDTITHQTAVKIGQWYHLAMVRSGSSTKSYLDGVQSAGTTSGTYSLTQSGSSIGTAYPGSGPLNGYISNLRIVKGTALYTANFTPPTAPLTAISGTQLLTCQSSRFVDNSSNAFTLTATGTPKISPTTPFAASSNYASYGSMYVPSAVTNYLALAHTAATTITSGSTDSFSAECWVYFNSATATTCIMDQSGQNTVTFQNWSLNLDSAKKFQIIWGGTGSPGSQIGYISGTTVAASGVWYHLAYVKTGVNWSLFVNGVREATYGGLNTASDGTQNPLRIGSDTFSSQSINGYIADVRVYKGATAGAPYDAASSTIAIPTAPLTAVTNTQLLTCQYNGGANNSGIVDNGPFNAIVTRNGNASQGTFSPFSPTGWSNYFNGSADYITVPATATAFGASNWTIECWVYVTSFAIAIVLFDTRSGTSPNNGVQCTIGTDGSVVWFEGSSSTIATAAAGSITLNTWYHIAFVRSGTGTNQCTVYVNGVSKTTGTSPLNHGGFTTYLGRNAAAAQNYFPGYISNFRVVNGTAVYTSAFSPSITPLTAIANTSILTCQSNRFNDNSTNNYAITIAGTPSVQAFSPFAPSAAYNPTLHGGSAYFDGTGDFLSMPGSASTNIGVSTASAFTVEAWIYPTAAKDTTVIGCAGSAWRLALTTSKTVSWVFNTSSSQTSTDAIKLNQWNHIAFTYDGLNSGTSNKMFVNGVVQASQGQLIPSSNTAGVIYVGRNADSAAWDFQGYISGARIIRGYAAYTANFTLPTAPFTSPTATPAALLLNFTNGGITDKHSSNVLETVGNAQLSTAVKKYGSASMQFDGTGDYGFSPTNDLYAFRTGDFTIEAWIYRTDTGVQRAIIDTRGGSVVGALFYITSNNKLNLFDSSTTWITSTNTVPANQWVHVAAARASGTTKLFIGGVQEASASDARVYVNSTGGLYIGRQYGSTSNDFLGYMDDVRITKGFARYTANFTPPTSAMLGQ